jgi:alanine dehydrogenase
MLVGVPREVKNHEYRVAITPAGVQELTSRGHDVLLERDAGAGAGLPDEEFRAAGARTTDDPDEVWGEAELLLKV